jgi:hypothetical protein
MRKMRLPHCEGRLISRSMKKLIWILSLSLASTTVLAAEKPNLVCKLGGYKVAGILTAKGFKLIKLVDQVNSGGDEYTDEDLYERSTVKRTRDGRVKIYLPCGDSNWQHNYTIVLPAKLQPGRVKAELEYDYYDEYDKSEEDYAKGYCDLR